MGEAVAAKVGGVESPLVRQCRVCRRTSQCIAFVPRPQGESPQKFLCTNLDLVHKQGG